MVSISWTLTACPSGLDKTSDMLWPGNRFMSIGGSYNKKNTQTHNLLTTLYMTSFHQWIYPEYIEKNYSYCNIVISDTAVSLCCCVVFTDRLKIIGKCSTYVVLRKKKNPLKKYLCSDLLIGWIQDQHADEVLSGILQVQKLSGGLWSVLIVLTGCGVVLDSQGKLVSCLLEFPADADTETCSQMRQHLN